MFEVKSFGRLDGKRRRQVERSLKKAVLSAPKMTSWVLVIPMNRTPTRPGAKSSEEAWFEGRLAEMAPGVDLDWYGLDWLDNQLAENMDLQRYIEGADSQLLQRAKEFNQEQAVLANGAADLHERVANLGRRVDEISPYWTLDFAVRDGVQWRTLRAKTEDAARLDPITITPTFTFRRGNPDDELLSAQLEQALAFGGEVGLPAGYLADITVDASDEAKKLFDTRDPAQTEVSFISTRSVLEPRIRCSYEVRAVDPAGHDDGVLAQFRVYLAERTAGNRGATLYGSDAGGVAGLTVGLPFPSRVPEEGKEIVLNETPVLQITLPNSLVGYDIDTLLPILHTLAAATDGTRIRFTLPGLGFVSSHTLAEPAFPGAAALHQVVADLHRLQEHMGSAFAFPADITTDQVKLLRRAARQLAGDEVEHDGGVTLTLRPGAATGFLKRLDDAPEGGRQGGILGASELVQFNVGTLSLIYGPSAFWAPRPQLVNRREVEAAAQAHDRGVDAVFEPTDMPFRWLSCGQSADYFDSDEHPTI